MAEKPVNPLDAKLLAAVTPVLRESIDPAKVEDALRAGADPNAKNEKGMPALHLALESADAVRILLGHGATPDIRDNDGNSALHDGGGERYYHASVIESFRLLLEHGVSVNATNKYGVTPLMNACWCSETDIEVIKFLIENGADVNAKDNQNTTALHCAIYDGQINVVNLLLASGASPKTKSKEYGTPCEYAQSCYEEVGGDVWLKILLKLKAAIKNPPKKHTKKPAQKPAKKENGTIASKKEQSNVKKENILTIPAGTVKIKDEAYQNRTEFTGIVIPAGVTEIGAKAFEGCTGLTSVNIPAGVTKIGEYAFDRCTGLTSVTIPDSVTNIGELAFHFCSALTSVNIPAGVTKIGKGVFNFCARLTSVDIPDSVKSVIPKNAFQRKTKIIWSEEDRSAK